MNFQNTVVCFMLISNLITDLILDFGTITLQIYAVKIQWKLDTCKKCTLYKYLPCTVQRRSYSKKTVNQLSIYLPVLGAPTR